MKLQISEDFSLPMDVVTKRLAFLGTTGSGKSYAAMKLAEELLLQGIQVIIMDPVGIHWGLRLSSDKKRPGIPINVFGGLYGDVPITATSGAMIADVIIEKKISAVIDVSQFEYDTDRAKFAAAFAQRFFFRKKAMPSPVMILLEEAQEFVPQNPEREENIMLHHFVRMCKIGRNFGIGIGIISQRPQEVNKKALNLSQCVFAFQTSGHHERKAIDEWIRDKGLNLDIAADLPKLPIGEPHLWSPGWLGISQKIKISKRITFHPSEEETISYEPGKLNKLSPVDIAKLSESIKETIEKAKENDPEALKKKIRELEKQLAGPAKKATPVVDDKRVPELKAENIQLKSNLSEAEKQYRHIHADVIKATNIFLKYIEEISGPIKVNIKLTDKEIKEFREDKSGVIRMDMPTVKPLSRQGVNPKLLRENNFNEEIKLKDGAKRMLAAAVKWNPKGITASQMKTQAAIKHANTFSTYKTQLISAGLLFMRNELFYPTETGIEYSGDTPSAETTEEVMNLWLPFFKDGARRMLKYLVYELRGEPTTHQELMNAAGIEHPNTYSTYKTQLKSAHLVLESGGQIYANQDTLFL